MTFGQLWAGRAFGTNIGNIFLKLDGPPERLSGKLHMNDEGMGFVVYSVMGSVDDHNNLSLTGTPDTHREGLILGNLSIQAHIQAQDQFTGEWSTDIGSAGTFVLHAHDKIAPQTSTPPTELSPEQLHTARHQFGAIAIDIDQIIALADSLQSDFDNCQLIITVVTDTEQARYLNDFKKTKFNTDRAKIIRLFAQQPEGNSINRAIQIEFGPQINTAMTQGANESWVLGMLQKIKRSIEPYERSYTTNFKKAGFGINQLLAAGMILFLPSLEKLSDRAVLMTGTLVSIFFVNRLHTRYLPLAAIYLRQRRKNFSNKIIPNLVSWLIAATAGLVVSLLAAYLKGILPNYFSG